jgi:hypothetical protein
MRTTFSFGVDYRDSKRWEIELYDTKNLIELATLLLAEPNPEKGSSNSLPLSVSDAISI